MDEPNIGMPVILIGLDGSGKSTQARLLMDFANKNAIPVSYVWMRLPWKLSLPLMILNRIAGITRKIATETGDTCIKTELWRNGTLAWLWRSWLPVAFKLTSYFKICRALRHHHLVIIDRYVFDALIDYAIDMNDDSWVDKSWNSFVKAVPSSAKVFYLDIAPEEAKKRKVGEDFGVAQRRRELYYKVAKMYGAQIIEADKSIQEIHFSILKICKLQK